MAKKNELKTESQIAVPTLQRLQVMSLMQTLSPQGGGQLVAGSFDATDPANLTKAIESDLPSEYDRAAMEGQIFEVVDWYARWVSNIAKEDSDPVPGIRITLWNPEGKRFTFSGTIAVKCWERIVTLIGIGPYDPPLGVTVQTFVLGPMKVSYGVIPVDRKKPIVLQGEVADRGPEATMNSGATEATG